MRFRLSALTLALGALVGALACSSAEAPAANTASAPAAQSTTPAAAPQNAAPSATAAEPANVAEIFPPGPGRDTVVNNCASCHNLACSAIGQRPRARWDSLEESHKDKVSDADGRAAFGYLKTRFNDSNPEPKVPPRFLQGGCTPF